MKLRFAAAALVIASLVFGFAAASDAQQLQYNTWVTAPTLFCAERVQYGPYLGVVGYAKIDVGAAYCGQNHVWVNLVTVDANNVLHNRGPCSYFESANYADHSCVGPTQSSFVEQTQSLLAAGERVFGMQVNACEPLAAGGRCYRYDYSLFG